MDTDKCVGHNTKGKKKGMRCEKAGTNAIGIGDFKVCAEHNAYVFRFTAREWMNDYAVPPWLKDIITRALKGRYDTDD